MLMKLYQKTGDRENQLEQAREISSIDPGHPSAETDAYKQEAIAVIQRLSGEITPDMRMNQAVSTPEKGSSIAIKTSVSISGPAAGILEEAGKNRAELEKAIAYFSKKGDALQLKALYFLLTNMGIHYSSDYYWSNGHAVPYTYRDIDSIKADLLIGNIQAAFEAWRNPWSRHVSFDEFCEYILPYRVSIEPLEKWRPLLRAAIRLDEGQYPSSDEDRIIEEPGS